jgi:hypothetical protein
MKRKRRGISMRERLHPHVTERGIWTARSWEKERLLYWADPDMAQSNRRHALGWMH